VTFGKYSIPASAIIEEDTTTVGNEDSNHESRYKGILPPDRSQTPPTTKIGSQCW
jgi:hypothetical protein